MMLAVVQALALALVTPPMPDLGRRDLLLSATASAALSSPTKASAAFFGLVEPPIRGELTYAELLEEASKHRLQTVQTAVSHDWVIATTVDGQRYSCRVLDVDFDNLLLEAMGTDGTMPFEVHMLPSAPA